jgi:hypothetical protein
MANKTNMGLWPGNRNQWSVSKLSGLESGAATPRIKGDRCLISNAVVLEEGPIIRIYSIKAMQLAIFSTKSKI